MSRVTAMTVGLILIFFGAQLYLVKAYYLSPKTARYMAEHFGGNSNGDSAERFEASGGSGIATWPFDQSGGSQSGSVGMTQFATNSLAAPLSAFGPKRVVPPAWLCWPCLFIGAVFYLHGAALREG